MAKCIYPITIGKQDGLKKWKVVPCGKCTTCRRRRQAGWSFRLLHEMQRSSSAAFLTLTYSDENLTYGNVFPTLVKRDLQLFWKKLRKRQALVTNDKIRYYAVGEYGTKTYRPHYHAIVFNLNPSLLFDGVLSQIWENGHVRIDECNIKTIQYTTKYCMKAGRQPSEGLEPEFSAMSKGLGKGFLTKQMKKFYRENEIPYIIWEDGKKQTMPRYYKEKIYNNKEDEYEHPEILRRFGREALEGITPETLDSTKIFEIEQMNKMLKRIQNEKRSTI